MVVVVPQRVRVPQRCHRTDEGNGMSIAVTYLVCLKAVSTCSRATGMSHWLRTEEEGQPPRPFRTNAFSGVATNAALGADGKRGAGAGRESANSLAVCGAYRRAPHALGTPGSGAAYPTAKYEPQAGNGPGG